MVFLTEIIFAFNINFLPLLIILIKKIFLKFLCKIFLLFKLIFSLRFIVCSHSSLNHCSTKQLEELRSTHFSEQQSQAEPDQILCNEKLSTMLEKTETELFETKSLLKTKVRAPRGSSEK